MASSGPEPRFRFFEILEIASHPCGFKIAQALLGTKVYYFWTHATKKKMLEGTLYRCLSKTIMILSLWALTGCGVKDPIPTVSTVDLRQFMGDWYVIASIPTVFEKEAFNAVESYRLNDDGTVQTTFRFNKGGSDGPEKTYRSKAYVLDTASNAHWGMQFVWPFKAEYRVIYLAEDYSRTVIGRSKRDYVWIMARKPTISDHDYAELIRLLASYGYDTDKVKKVSQQAANHSPPAN